MKESDKRNNIKKKEQLGMHLGTASARLRKLLIFNFLKELKRDYCFQCKLQIKNIEELSIEHKKNWMYSEDPIKFFFDLNNIAFSHLTCNVRSGKGYKGKRKEFCKRGHKMTEENRYIINGNNIRCWECRRLIEYPKRKRDFLKMEG